MTRNQPAAPGPQAWGGQGYLGSTWFRAGSP
jgi:hypothetical protein